MTKNRGRPPKLETLELRKAKKIEEELMAVRPERKGKTNTSASSNWNSMLESMELTRKIILANFKPRWAPDEHAYNMAALGDEWFEGNNRAHAEKILKDDAMYQSQARKIRQRAGGTNITKSLDRSENILQINQVLIKKIAPGSAYKPNSVAKQIVSQWNHLSEAQRLVGEPKSMKRRGDGGKPVSVRTIERWLKKVADI